MKKPIGWEVTRLQETETAPQLCSSISSPSVPLCEIRKQAHKKIGQRHNMYYEGHLTEMFDTDMDLWDFL